MNALNDIPEVDGLWADRAVQELGEATLLARNVRIGLGGGLDAAARCLPEQVAREVEDASGGTERHFDGLVGGRGRPREGDG